MQLLICFLRVSCYLKPFAFGKLLLVHVMQAHNSLLSWARAKNLNHHLCKYVHKHFLFFSKLGQACLLNPERQLKVEIFFLELQLTKQLKTYQHGGGGVPFCIFFVSTANLSYLDSSISKRGHTRIM